MLTTLRIKNLAVVSDLALDLAPGYNAITGETGAGKSVIIGALNLVLGERADRALLRAGAESCTVEAVFAADRLPAEIHEILAERGLEPCEENQLVLKRTFTSGGANKQFANGSPCSLAVLAELGTGLVDMHGPHDHQSLLRPAKQLEILDAYGELSARREAFAALTRQHRELLRRKSELIVDEQTYAQQLDLLRHQVREITQARLNAGEDEALESEYTRASNAARLTELVQTALGTLGEHDPSALSQIGAAGRSLHELARLDPSAKTIVELLDSATSQLRELQRELGRYGDAIEIDPGRLRELEERLNLLQSLRRKYGATLPAVILFGQQASAKLEALESRDAELERIQSELRDLENTLWREGAALSAARRRVIPDLSQAAARELSTIGFKRSAIEVSLSQLSRERAFGSGPVSPAGFDAVEFLFAPNPGEPARPLATIASSGELARVMLALKTVLAAQDSVPVLVFDEVDANVGGETAGAVGEKMRAIGRQRQVLCITHLAQVAAAASAHYVVTKEVRADRTLSRIEPLDGPGRVLELARMLGGGEAAKRHAEAMLGAGG